MNDRIKKLAEALGWELRVVANASVLGLPDGTERWHTPSGAVCADVIALPFDPYKDANDDYAVLEWMRDEWRGSTTGCLWKDKEKWIEIKILLARVGEYQIGDYARAYWKVIWKPALIAWMTTRQSSIEGA